MKIEVNIPLKYLSDFAHFHYHPPRPLHYLFGNGWSRGYNQEELNRKLFLLILHAREFPENVVWFLNDQYQEGFRVVDDKGDVYYQTIMNQPIVCA